ncbi:hypothetical protein [Hydrogenimonas sp.]|uniref:hypothetical protein n=1 Tax=Hydrogenimonas sp. TaxID=2231112 RepID=UPI002630A12C|nr:hypothetical protein [Hydrogenimonas sp.]
MVSTIGRLIPLLFLLVFSPALVAGDYYISYRLHSSDFILVDEHLYISKAMVPFERENRNICTFVTEAEDFKTFAREENQELLECLFEHGVIVKSREKILDLVSQRESLELILPPTPLQVEFNDGLVIIKKVTGH